MSVSKGLSPVILSDSDKESRQNPIVYTAMAMRFSSIKFVCIRNQPEIFLNCTSLVFSTITFI